MEIVIIAVGIQLIDIVLYAQVPWSQRRVIPWFVRWLPLSGFLCIIAPERNHRKAQKLSANSRKCQLKRATVRRDVVFQFCGF